jgi:hypothetical protein
VIDFKNFRLNLFTHLFFWICSSEQSANKSNTSAPKRKKTSSKTKPSLATMPDTPDARAPFKSAPADIPLKERDVINLEDESDKVAGNDVGVDISMDPAREERSEPSAEATADDVSQKIISTKILPSTHPHMFLTLRCAPLQHRYDKITDMMNEVWGKVENEKWLLDD